MIKLVFLLPLFCAISGQDAGIECTKQPYKEKCSNGRKAQYTLRWYVKDGKCCSYPWGHCKGDEIAKENVARTKAVCEQVCLGGGGGGGSTNGNGGGGSTNGGNGGGNGGSTNGNGGSTNGNGGSTNGNGGSTNGNGGSTNGNGRGGHGTNGGGGTNGQGGGTNGGTGGGSSTNLVDDPCQKQEYKAECSNGRKSQYTLRWYLKDGKCCSYPWGHCKGDEIAKENVLRTKADCEAVCTGAGGGGGNGGGSSNGTPGGSSPNFGGPGTGNTGNGGNGNGYTGNGGPGAGNNGNGGNGAGNTGNGGPGTGNTGTSGTGGPSGGSGPAKPTCEKQPYKEKCDNGRKSQYTLRYYLKDGKCCSYPWGHCKGDEVAKESAIRTKKACEEICINAGK